MAKKARFWTALKANQIALDYIVLSRSGAPQNKPYWTGPKCLFWNNTLWAQVNDFCSSRSHFDGSRQALWGLSRKGVQLPYWTSPDSSNVISPIITYPLHMPWRIAAVIEAQEGYTKYQDSWSNIFYAFKYHELIFSYFVAMLIS